jgi:hypothetical protein
MICGHFEIDTIYLDQRYPSVFARGDFKVLTFVREPLPLRLSLLCHEIDHGRISGEEPIERLLFDRPNWLCKRFPCSEDDMFGVLSRYFFVGIAEESQAGFDWLADALGKKPVRLPRLNCSRPRTFDITPRMTKEFREVHALDYRLYDHCVRMWRSR